MYRTKQQLAHDASHHSEFLVMLARMLQVERYVELGIQHGFTFAEMVQHARHCIGVDPVKMPLKTLPATDHIVEIVYERSVDFLRHVPDAWIDLCFVDSLHDFEYAKEEWSLLKPKMADNGIVVWHDTYPSNESKLDPRECGDVWKMHSILRHEEQWEYVTMPMQFGLTVARKGRGLLWMG